MSVRILVAEDAAGAAAEVGRRLAEAAARGAHVALSGGSTVGDAYAVAARLEPDWSRAEVWWGDERAVPPDDERSNFRLARERLLAALAAPPAAVHRMRGELPPDEAAAAYEEELAGRALDLALQGIGADGHTASLFPGKASVGVRDRLVVASEPGLEPFVPRITLTLPALNRSGEVVFLVTGEQKADAVRRAFAEPPAPSTPASLVRSAAGATVAVLDRAAASRLQGFIETEYI